MDIERTLLTKALQTGDLPDVITRGIDTEHFADPDCRDVYDYAKWFQVEYGSPPSLKAVREEFPDFETSLSKDPLKFHLDNFILKIKERTAIDLVRDYHEAIEDPEELDQIELRALEMARMLTEVVPASRAYNYADPARVEKYRERKSRGEQIGVFMGIPKIDEIMRGIQPHELVVIAAYMGVGKSTLMQFIAYMVYLQRKKSLIISLEMEAEAILRKIDTMSMLVKYQAMKAMELGYGEEEQWKRILEEAHKDRHEADIYIVDDIKNCTVDRVMAETMRYKPDVVMVDYLELMTVPRGVQSSHWESVSHSGIGLKQMARINKTPVITAAQLNRDAGKGDVTLANVSFQSVGKHSDLVIGLAQDEEKEARQEMDVILLKNRDGPRTRVTMRWQLENMDIGEKGTDERFPARRGAKSLIGHTKRKAQRMEIARNVAGKENPFGRKRGQHTARNVGRSKKKSSGNRKRPLWAQKSKA